MASKKEFGLYPALILRLFCIKWKCGALVSLNFGNVLKQVSILWGSTWQFRLHSVTPTVPESVSFYSAWKGKEFCYCLFMFSAPLNGELYLTDQMHSFHCFIYGQVHFKGYSITHISDWLIINSPVCWLDKNGNHWLVNTWLLIGLKR